MVYSEDEQAVDKFIKTCSYEDYYHFRAMMGRVPALSQIDSVRLVQDKHRLRGEPGLRRGLKFSVAEKKVLFGVLFSPKEDGMSMSGKPLQRFV